MAVKNILGAHLLFTKWIHTIPLIQILSKAWTPFSGQARTLKGPQSYHHLRLQFRHYCLSLDTGAIDFLPLWGCNSGTLNQDSLAPQVEKFFSKEVNLQQVYFCLKYSSKFSCNVSVYLKPSLKSLCSREDFLTFSVCWTFPFMSDFSP